MYIYVYIYICNEVSAQMQSHICALLYMQDYYVHLYYDFTIEQMHSMLKRVTLDNI